MPLSTTGRVFFLAAATFALGIFIRSLYVLPISFVAIAALAAVAALATWVVARQPVYIFFGVALAALTFGVVRVSVTPQELPSAFADELDTDVSLTGTVSAAPDIRESSQRITITVSKDNATTRVLAVVSLGTPVSYGERVTVRGKLTSPQSFATDYGRTFRYDRYLAATGVFAIMPHALLTEVAPPYGVWAHVYGALIGVKRSFLHALGLALPEPAASLAGGLVAGGTEGLGASLTSDFVRSGLIHIVVLSGYNVMIVAEAVLFALSFLARRAAAGIAALVIGAFVLAAGAGAASIRAGLMAGFALLARATGRTYDVTRALVVAALLMLLWNPLLLAFSLGFDLSIIATLGLILGVPLIEPHLAFIKNLFLRETAAATITAQIAVLPLLLYANGLFSIVALPANLLVLPLVPLAMATSAFAGLVGVVLPALAPASALPAYALLSYIAWVVHAAATLPLATVAVPSFSFVFVILAYAFLALPVYRLAKNKKPALANTSASQLLQ
ncbi:MAG: hypothetical protein B7X04_02180 [Parcubacteria group bacterium 21-54-25]|nr:MAG: hypothetical protein B7X04_02180 [Parcubacteria group bacterium 21-54-25]HQU07855.1 ComEC/Rec2 family competence protein [Candidatus Paceibacterota bacterium]